MYTLPTLVSGIALLFCSAASAQDTLTHQGRLLDAAGGAIEGTHELTFTISSDDGTPLYVESPTSR